LVRPSNCAYALSRRYGIVEKMFHLLMQKGKQHRSVTEEAIERVGARESWLTPPIEVSVVDAELLTPGASDPDSGTWDAANQTGIKPPVLLDFLRQSGLKS